MYTYGCCNGGCRTDICACVSAYIQRWFNLCDYAVQIKKFHPRHPLVPTGIVVGHCVRPSARPERLYRSSSLKISAISQKFGVRVCAVPGSRSLLIMTTLGQFLRVPRNFKIVHDRIFWPGLRDAVASLTLYGFQVSAWNGGMMHSYMKQNNIKSGHARSIVVRSMELCNFPY